MLYALDSERRKNNAIGTEFIKMLTQLFLASFANTSIMNNISIF